MFSVYIVQTKRPKKEKMIEMISKQKETRKYGNKRWKTGRLSLFFIAIPIERSGWILGQLFRFLNNEPAHGKMFGTQHRAQDVIQTCFLSQISSCFCIYFFLTIYGNEKRIKYQTCSYIIFSGENFKMLR